MTIAEVIEKIETEHADISDILKTCDGVICGDISQECSGIAVTCCSTAAVIQKAAQFGCNLLITHEPTFYHGYDETERIRDTRILKEKKRLIREKRMVIYRDHDRAHRETPDMIYSGIEKVLGWKPFALDSSFLPISGYEIPEMSLEELGKFLGNKLGIAGMRIVGPADMKVKRVGLTAHFFGGEEDQDVIRLIEEKEYDAVIPLETVDWTIIEYIMDSEALGRKRGLLMPGHFNLEEAGMRAAAEWIRKTTGDKVPVTFIQSGDMYGWVSSKKEEKKIEQGEQ